MDSIKVWLDDRRPAPPGWIHVYWPDEAIVLLDQGNVAEISLDHDLGDGERGTGYDVILWIEEAVATQGFVPPRMYVHSDNAPARQKMLRGIESIERLAERQERGHGLRR